MIRVTPCSWPGRLTLQETPAPPPAHNTMDLYTPSLADRSKTHGDSRVSRARKVVARSKVKFETLWRPQDPPEVRSVAPRGVTTVAL